MNLNGVLLYFFLFKKENTCKDISFLKIFTYSTAVSGELKHELWGLSAVQSGIWILAGLVLTG